MKASVVIRTYNSVRTIREVLEGVHSQRFEDYEVVIVDSGSIDGTLGIVRDYPHTLVDYSGEEFSYSGSLNAGFEVAGGEYVVSLSSHCIPLHEEWLGELVGAMEGDERIAGAWGPLLFEVGPHQAVKKGEVELIGLEDLYRRPNRGLQNPNSIIRRALWEERPFAEEVERCEDQEWARHFLRQGYYTAMVRGAPVLYKIPHGPYKYGKKMMQDFLVLYDLFGYRPGVSTVGLLRGSARLLGAAVLGKRSPRVSVLFVASLAGRWTADKLFRYRRLKDYLDQGPENKAVLLTKILASKFRRRLQVARPVAKSMSVRVSRPKGASPPSGELKTRFFLVGEMRSGTSWLSRTLNSHPEVYCKGEGSFFGRDQSTEEIPVYKDPTPSLRNALLKCEGLRTWRSFMWNSWAEGDGEDDVRDLTRLIIDYYLAKGSAASGKRIVGDKSPLHTYHVDEIFELYPEAKVIHIFRDGRDVAVSLMHHFWRLSRDRGGIFDLDPEELAKRDAYSANPEGFLASGESIFIEERLRQMAVRWGRRVSKASREGAELFGDSFFELRYEDLLVRPEENLKSIFELLSARADEGVVRRCVEENRFERLAKREKGREDSASFFRKGVVGDWREVFTARDREVYEEVAGETLLKMGYSLD